MPKIPNKSEKSRDDDEDYEIVSFEDFCDKSPTSNNKKDLLSLNDNINYRLCYEGDRLSQFPDKEGETSREADDLKETSLSGSKSSSWKRRTSSGFSPFGKHNSRGKASLLSGVMPKNRTDGESSGKEHRYQRFSERRNLWARACSHIPGPGSSALLVVVVCVLAAGAWWAAGGALGGAWGEERYKRLWARAHPDQITSSVQPYIQEKAGVLPEFRYHDHNNLSTKNKNNGTDPKKKPDGNKKSSTYTEQPVPGLNNLCSKVEEDLKFDCFPQIGSNEEGCIQRGCCWNSSAKNNDGAIGRPYCFYPPHYDTFHFVNMTENRHGIMAYYEKLRPSGYPDDFEIAKMDFRYLSNDVLQIKIYDGENRRFEPPYPEIPMISGPINNLKYRVVLESTKTGFKVVRNSDNVTILNTQDIGGLILSDKFLQLTTLLPAKKLYGLGERRSRFQLNMNWQQYTIFNYDTPPQENTNLYGSHPFYLALEDSGMSHGMLLLNSHAMDVVLQPAPAITYRTIGGILNFYVFFGPSPSDVVSQYTNLIGLPFMPPYWSLGFHLCKFNYGSLNVTQDVWEKNRNAGIPFDVQWNDLDYMNNSNDFTYDHVKFKGLPQFVKKLHNVGMHYIPLIDPGVSASEPRGQYPPYDRGVELDVFIKNSSALPFVGKVWNKGSTVWPDFTHPDAMSYWVEMLSALHQMVPYDGAWIDMNEPSNFLNGPMYGACENEEFPYMPHVTGDHGLKSKTLCMDAIHYGGKHFDWHNLYSLTESIATNFALTELRGKRPFIISRSTFVGSGRYAGHWSGDIASQWHDMQMTIPELLSFSLFGVAMMGADICGFRGDASPELCTRWMQLGAFYPFARNHNSDSSKPQDPVSLGPAVVAASREALRLRYTLLPYMYTLFHRAHLHGETVARPMFFEFPSDKATHAIDTQFMLGPAILVAPILNAGQAQVQAYLPNTARWYNLRDGRLVNVWQNLTDFSTALIRGGSILPLQMPPETGPVSTTVSRSAPMQVLAAPDAGGCARGQLYWDDGDSINSYEEKKFSHVEFTMANDSLTSSVQWWGYGIPPIDKIIITSVRYTVKTVTLNNKPCKKPCSYTQDLPKQTLTVDNLMLSLDKPFAMSWTYKHNVKPYTPRTNKLSVINNTVVVCKNSDCSVYD